MSSEEQRGARGPQGDRKREGGVDANAHFNRGWVVGFAMGLAEANRLNHDYQAVRHSMRCNNVTFAEMKRAGVSDYDLRELRGLSRLVRRRVPTAAQSARRK